ncbi:MAG: hypothetical protein R3A46_03530 [Thermomicrobiales bacterium]
MVSRQPDPSTSNSSGSRHEVITSLQILTLTAELLAIDLRNEEKSRETVQRRGAALGQARKRLSAAARRLQARTATRDSGVSAGTPLASTTQMQEILAFVGMITEYVTLPNVERDVLAEYVDHLHDRSDQLVALLNASPDRGNWWSADELGDLSSGDSG